MVRCGVWERGRTEGVNTNNICIYVLNEIITLKVDEEGEEDVGWLHIVYKYAADM